MVFDGVSNETLVITSRKGKGGGSEVDWKGGRSSRDGRWMEDREKCALIKGEGEMPRIEEEGRMKRLHY